MYAYFGDLNEKIADFVPYSIGNAMKLPDWAKILVQQFASSSCVVSENMKTIVGTTHVGDVVWLREPLQLANVKLAIRAVASQAVDRFLFVVERFRSAPSAARSSQISNVDVVDAPNVSGLCCHIAVGVRIYV